MSPLRILTPAQFLICMILFFLPWIEVQCQMPDLSGLGKLDAKEPIGAPKKPAAPTTVSWITLVSQSGFQTATGDYTIPDSTVRSMMGSKKKADDPEAKEDEITAAPLLFGYLGAVGIGLLLGFILPLGGARKAVILFICLIALAAIGGQTAVGFPIAKKIEQQRKNGENPFGGGDGIGAKQGGADNASIRVQYTIPFYLAIAFIIGAAVTVLIEPGKKKPKPLRKKPRSEDEELAEGAEADEFEPPAGQNPPELR